LEFDRHFTPAWWTVIMGTGAVALLFHNFPYGGPDNPALRGLFMAFYMLNFVRAILISADLL
jgi:tellurite resistance protein TehA-like permease